MDTPKQSAGMMSLITPVLFLLGYVKMFVSFKIKNGVIKDHCLCDVFITSLNSFCTDMRTQITYVKLEAQGETRKQTYFCLIETSRYVLFVMRQQRCQRQKMFGGTSTSNPEPVMLTLATEQSNKKSKLTLLSLKKLSNH